jgi:hypothetical protein
LAEFVLNFSDESRLCVRTSMAEASLYFRRKTSAGRAYLQIVESRRTGEQMRQQVIVTLGRYEDLQASGQLERLLRSGARFEAKAMVLSAAADDAAIKIAVRRSVGVGDGRRIGPAPGPVVTGDSPEVSFLGAAAARVEHWRHGLIDRDLARGQDELAQPSMKRLESAAA